MSLELARNFAVRMAEISQSRFHVVTAAQELRAEAMLSSTPILQISSSDAAKFLGGVELDRSSGKYFLARGCVQNEATGRFRISVSGKELLVSHVSLGTTQAEPKNRALVVVLNEQPADVFVACGLAQ
jgi:hypothetical protein